MKSILNNHKIFLSQAAAIIQKFGYSFSLRISINILTQTMLRYLIKLGGLLRVVCFRGSDEWVDNHHVIKNTSFPSLADYVLQDYFLTMQSFIY